MDFSENPIGFLPFNIRLISYFITIIIKILIFFCIKFMKINNLNIVLKGLKKK